MSIRVNMIACIFKRIIGRLNILFLEPSVHIIIPVACGVMFYAKIVQCPSGAVQSCFQELRNDQMELPHFCSVSEMFAERRVDCFYELMRKRCASQVYRVRASQNGILGTLADRLNCYIVNRFSSISVVGLFTIINYFLLVCVTVICGCVCVNNIVVSLFYC
ncbi:hypothetical protein PYW08_015278 [Mythimna loreyi]|uniref:Uncharacterized protein n=1 Tax=Mythimna loreyi TaxID=667449 RepID=A0ACC2QZC8_9NEOP|nr:hypothetical protein PYW08_015278 [Mythimna loreyi]